MAVVVLEGLLTLVLMAAELREAVMRAVPLSMKLAIGVGIGLRDRLRVVMIALGRAREVHPLMWTVAALFLVYFAVRGVGRSAAGPAAGAAQRVARRVRDQPGDPSWPSFRGAVPAARAVGDAGVAARREPCPLAP